jgi:hypothetical protein
MNSGTRISLLPCLYIRIYIQGSACESKRRVNKLQTGKGSRDIERRADIV